MYHFRLAKALSYKGVVSATKAAPDVFVEDAETAEKVKATGYFTLVEETPDPPEPDPALPEGKTLEKMTVPELETCAAYFDVSLKGITGKANIIAKLREELGEEAEGVIEFGSPTMVELQES